MKKLFEEAQQLNERANRPGYNTMTKCCGTCKHFDEGDRYSGDSDTCTIYEYEHTKHGVTSTKKMPTEIIEAYGLCNLWEKF